MSHLTVTESARRDLDRLHSFLADQSLRSAESLIDLLKEELLLLLEQPSMGRPIDRTFREWKVRFGRGAYRIKYSVTDDEVKILRVEHSRERRS